MHHFCSHVLVSLEVFVLWGWAHGWDLHGLLYDGKSASGGHLSDVSLFLSGIVNLALLGLSSSPWEKDQLFNVFS